MSTILPLSARTTSPGRVECGPGMFSTAGATARSGVPGREPGDRLDRGDDRRGAGLVHLHLFHPVGRLDRDAAGVEADALADDRQVATRGASVSPGSPERRTIIRGGLSLPRPTARNMPIPSLAARSGVDDVDRQAVALRRSPLASSARTSGLTSFEARLARRPGDVGALADDPAALGGRGERRRRRRRARSR